MQEANDKADTNGRALLRASSDMGVTFATLWHHLLYFIDSRIPPSI